MSSSSRLVHLLAHPWFGMLRDSVLVFLATAAILAVSDGYPPHEVVLLGLINAALVIVWFFVADVYDVSQPRTATPPLGRLVRGLVWVLLTYLATHFVTVGDPERRTIVFATAASVSAVVVGYVLRGAALVWFQRRGILRERLLIVGGDEHAQLVATQIAEQDPLSVQLVGALDEFSPRSSRLGPIEVLGDPLDLESALIRTQATAVVVITNAISWEAQEHVMQVAADRPGLRVFMVAGVSDLLSSEVVAARDGLPPLVRLRPAHLRGANAFLKRALDISGALALTPLLALVLMVALASGGRPLTRIVQVLGRGGRPTPLRLLAPGRATGLRARLARGRAGKLTALPAVIAGSISLVGPRPIPASALDTAVDLHWRRRLLLTPPGLTGPWDRDGTSADGILDELTYIRTYSIWSDVRLLATSLRRVVRREGSVPAMRAAHESREARELREAASGALGRAPEQGSPR